MMTQKPLLLQVYNLNLWYVYFLSLMRWSFFHLQKTLLMTIFNLILTTQSTSTIILVIHQHAPAFSYRIRSITSRSKATSLWEATLVIPDCHGPLPLQMIRTSLFSAITESDEVLLLFSQDLIKQLKNKGSS